MLRAVDLSGLAETGTSRVSAGSHGCVWHGFTSQNDQTAVVIDGIAAVQVLQRSVKTHHQRNCAIDLFRGFLLVDFDIASGVCAHEHIVHHSDPLSFAYSSKEGFMLSGVAGGIKSQNILGQLLSLPNGDVEKIIGFFCRYGFFFPLKHDEYEAIDANSAIEIINRIKATIRLMNSLAGKKDYKSILVQVTYLLFSPGCEVSFSSGTYSTCRHSFSKVLNGHQPFPDYSRDPRAAATGYFEVVDTLTGKERVDIERYNSIRSGKCYDLPGASDPRFMNLVSALYSVSNIWPGIVELALGSYTKSFSCTKYTPRRLSSAEAILFLFPIIMELTTSQNLCHVIPVSRIFACGTGGMLIEAIRNMDDEKQSYGKIYGQEKNLSTSAIARMNLFLHGAKEFKIRREDTLRKPLFIHNGQLQQFDCVLANPPFGLDHWGAEIFEADQYGRNIWGSPTDSNADYAWLQHMVKSMRPGKGRCAVVMPQGVLFHGSREGAIRQKMIESDIVECVIALVGNLFYGAGVSACILYLNNNKPLAHRGKICMIDATGIYTAQRAKNIMTEKNTDEVFKLWQNYTPVMDKCAIVDLDTIAEKGYTLSVNTYIEKTPAAAIDPKKVRREFMSALQEVRDCEAELKRLLQEGGYING